MLRKEYVGLYVLLIPFAIALIAVLATAAYRPPSTQPTTVSGSDAAQGVQALADYGCGACHVIAGVSGATGTVGPALNNLAQRAYIAGKLQNTPDNLVQWIRFPQEVEPGVDMPDLGVTEAAARDIAAYLYTLK
ncbi:MAG TPA: c-type cytochrome [Phototrophicaceae bacterium]|nr:c-type cytochrome [Phototrophicaceae bacterium]